MRPADDPLVKLPRWIRREVRGAPIGGFIRRISRHPDLTAAEEKALGERIQAGDRDAWRELVEHNLKLAVWGAARLAWPGTPFEDVLQSSFEGVMRAAEKFAPAQGNRFSTYAFQWMRAKCERYMQDHGWLIRLPATLQPAHQRHRIRRETMPLGTMLADGEGEVDAIWAEELRMRLTLMEPFRLGCDVARGEATDEDDPHELAAERQQGTFIERCINQVLEEEEPRDREMLGQRLGWGGAEPMTLAAVGAGFDITRERVRQVESRLLNVLRRELVERWPEDFERWADAPADDAERDQRRENREARRAGRRTRWREIQARRDACGHRKPGSIPGSARRATKATEDAEREVSGRARNRLLSQAAEDREVSALPPHEAAKDRPVLDPSVGKPEAVVDAATERPRTAEPDAAAADSSEGIADPLKFGGPIDSTLESADMDGKATEVGVREREDAAVAAAGDRVEGLRVGPTLVERVSYAAWQNSVAVLPELRIENETERRFEDLKLTLTCEPPLLKERSWAIDRLNPGAPLLLRDREVRLAGPELARLGERRLAEACFTLRDAEGRVLAEERREVTGLARNEWGGCSQMPELLAAFVMPNEPAVAGLLRAAVGVLEAAGKEPSFDGYQSGRRERAWEVAAALWSAVAARRLVYAEPPASFETAGQKLRTPGEALGGGLATCLDLTLLFASALEAAGLHAFVVFTEGHAFPGFWLAAPGVPCAPGARRSAAAEAGGDGRGGGLRVHAGHPLRRRGGGHALSAGDPGGRGEDRRGGGAPVPLRGGPEAGTHTGDPAAGPGQRRAGGARGRGGPRGAGGAGGGAAPGGFR